jgi:hypothetical protein
LCFGHEKLAELEMRQHWSLTQREQWTKSRPQYDASEGMAKAPYVRGR